MVPLPLASLRLFRGGLDLRTLIPMLGWNSREVVWFRSKLNLVVEELLEQWQLPGRDLVVSLFFRRVLWIL